MAPPSAPCTSQPAKGPASDAWWMLAVLFLFYCIAFIDRYALTVMVDPIKADLTLTDFQMSVILGPAFSVPMALFGIPLGYVSDTYSRRLVIYFGMTAWSCAAMSSVLIDSFYGLLVVRIFIAIGEASLLPAAYSLLADGFEKRRLSTAMAIFQAGAYAGMAAAFTLAALAMVFASSLQAFDFRLAGISDWKGAFFLLGAPGVILAFLAFTFREPRRRGARKAKSDTEGRLLSFLKHRRRLMLPLAVGGCLLATASQGLTAWAPTFVSRHYGLPPLQYGPVLSLLSLVSVVTVIAKGSVMDWLFSRGMKDAHVRFYTWLLMLGVPLLSLSFFLPKPWMFFIALGVLQCIILPFAVYFVATIQLVVPANLRGQVTGLFIGMIALLGNGFGPLAVAGLNDFWFRDDGKIGWSLSIVTTLCTGISLVILRSLLRHLRYAIEERETEELAFESSGQIPSSR